MDDDDVSWKSRPAEEGEAEEEEEGDESDRPVVSSEAAGTSPVACSASGYNSGLCSPVQCRTKAIRQAPPIEWKRFNWLLQDPVWLGHRDQRFCLPSFWTPAGADPQGIA